MSDAYSPPEIAQRVRSLGVTKAKSDGLTLLLLATLAGAFIALGGMLFAVITTDSTLGMGPTRLLGGIGFALGLILVVVAGAELFTGNNLLAMAWASSLIDTRKLVRNWVLVYVGNVIGALATVLLCYFGEVHTLGRGNVLVANTAFAIGMAKAELSFTRALALGILCNALVCLAVWLTLGCRSVADKILAIVFPIAAFVACGFEHSIANWFFLPYAALLGASEHPDFIAGAVHNLAVVTVGNIIGGTILVAGIYWGAYLRHSKDL